MLAVGHTAIGVAIGLGVTNPLAAFGLGVISHHIADAVPHFDPGSYLLDQPWRPRSARELTVRDWIFVSIDFFLSLILLLVVYTHLPADRWLSVGAGILGALLPDLIHNVPFWGPKLRTIGWIRWWLDNIHRRFQWTLPSRLWMVGVAIQVVTVALVLWYLFTF